MSDAYRPIAGMLPVAERFLEALMARARRDVARAARRHGLRCVLDLACGAGGQSRRLAGAGVQPVGLDLSWTMLAQAAAGQRRGPRFPLVLGDAAALPFRAGVFDGAALSLALHEMDAAARERVWSEMRRVVRAGGLLILVDFHVVPGAGPLSRLGRAAIHYGEARVGRIHPPHYSNYLDYMAKGGLRGWLETHPGTVVEERAYYWGNVGLVATRRD